MGHSVVVQATIFCIDYSRHSLKCSTADHVTCIYRKFYDMHTALQIQISGEMTFCHWVRNSSVTFLVQLKFYKLQTVLLL